ncbi:cysteinyl leukotriene receptor 2-like [Microcaecilia unicolor]|uniref:Cysteinyl leukotriene receptor 2-like n=1 Tax=Microcaecilia unicolor TaxID=1415580 RepID=A0A6P7WQN5_9AMPH|nr:cysteinyl leukotriene receptor 2-like [Microcaecilia unicolor]XP_030043445.1 cysteinyl leukotriene receptor 2-like [Microcaecilia unicolor]XP_030043446.1 cysteinyl leukotriene receptor 2-like [Microcaecilia unicolor]
MLVPTMGFHPVLTNSSSYQQCSHDYKFPIYTGAYLFIFLLGFSFNASSLYVFLCLIPRRTPNNIFMINLAVSDLFFTLTLPLRIIYYLRQGDWIFGSPLCGILIYTFYLNMYTSILFLTALSVSRYVAVLHPMRIRVLFSFRRSVVISVVIWLVVGLATSPFLLAKSFWRDGKVRCFEPRDESSLTRILIMNYSGLIVGFAIPFFTIVICYACIIRHLKRGSQDLKGCQPRRDRVIALIVIVLCVFFFCFLPYHIQRTVHLHFATRRRDDCSITLLMQKMVVLTICMASTNSCFNPLLYYFAGSSFRSALRSKVRHNNTGSSWKGHGIQT